jgi:hypothetical protein
MTKTQKIWLGIFLAMFAIPEILWSPVMNEIIVPRFFSSTPWRYSFLYKPGNVNMLIWVLLIQFLGMGLATVTLFFSRKNLSSKFIFWLFFVLMSLLTIYIYLVFDTTKNYKLNLVL